SPGQYLETIPVIQEWIGRPGRRHPKQFPAQRALPRALTIVEEAEVSEAVKSVRQHVDQKTAHELPAVQRHRLLAVPVAVLFPTEADLVVVHRQQAIVRDRDAV